MTKVTVNISSECSDEALGAIFKRVEGIKKAVGDIDLTVNVGERKPTVENTINISGAAPSVDDLKEAFARDCNRFRSPSDDTKSPREMPAEDLVEMIKNSSYRWTVIDSENQTLSIDADIEVQILTEKIKKYFGDPSAKPEKRPINELIEELVDRRAELPSAWFSEHKPELKGNTFIDFRFTWALKGKKPTPPPAD